MEKLHQVCATITHWPYVLGKGKQMAAVIGDVLGSTWAAIDASCDAITAGDLNPFFAPRGQSGTGPWLAAMDMVCWCAKLNLALVKVGVVSQRELQQSLPTPHQLAEFGRKSPESMGGDVSSAPMHSGVSASHLLAALVCEKYLMDDEALAYIAVIFDLDPNLGGDPKPTSHILAYCLKGRIMARRGEVKAAADAFEDAVSRSEKYELWLLTAFALRDLKLLVQDSMGHGEHGSRRLGAVLRRLTGSADALTPLLDGLDATELLSLAPPDATYHVAYSVEDSATGELRAELSGMKLSALKSRARELGVSEALLEDADDADDIKAAVTELCIEAATAGKDGGQEVAALRKELASLKLKALKTRAREAGVGGDALSDADDAEDIKQAVTELIVVAMQASPREDPEAAADDRPHFGSAPAAAQPQPAQPAQSSSGAKHVMLSYQWAHQAQVTRVYDTLTRLGVKCWMDISGGMGQDIYESMAEGVSNASAVVCFMSQKYQLSENCTLEIKYAKQCGVEIIPVMMEGGGWRASGYLGIITAGALWTPLSDESQFEENVRQLHGQIQKGLGASSLDLEVRGDDEGAATVKEAKEELERLRDDLMSKEDTASAAVLADPSQPATIPAGVPKLPPKFQSTEQIEELTKLLLSTAAADMTMSRVGFWGMGGIGKTVTGAALVRDEDVRKHFHAIIWLPLGQTPVIAKLQNLCHMQCTGKELSGELSSDEKQEALQQAMSGKRVLLCFDDLWEEEHELELNFVDVSAGSKVLISTRMKALLAGGHQIEVGLPSPSDSARMLLAAADADVSGRQPAGVSEIVDLCGRLPLALGIAGRLAAGLGLVGTQSWSDMIGVLKEELRESHSGGTEEGMIRASLRGLKGSAKEQASVRGLLVMFAFVPEDTFCPLEVMLLMFNVVSEGSDATMMHVRKWLRILLNRSLVLGTIDRPSVHDLVLDFAVAQHNADALRLNHRRIVEAFRAARPVDVHGRRKYDVAQKDDPVSVYACHEIGYHLEQAWQANKLSDELATSGWLADVPQDAIVVATGRVLGPEQMTMLAETAEASKDWWLAARYWAIVQSVLPTATVAGLGPTVKALDAMAALGNISESDDKEEHELAQVTALAAVWVTVCIRIDEFCIKNDGFDGKK